MIDGPFSDIERLSGLGVFGLSFFRHSQRYTGAGLVP
jgi:hypothetical protein